MQIQSKYSRGEYKLQKRTHKPLTNKIVIIVNEKENYIRLQ
jgi:hypothetical protein